MTIDGPAIGETPPLERERDLAVLEEVLARGRGLPGPVLIEGPAGIGRSRLVDELIGNRCPSNRWGGADCTLSYDATVTFDKFADFEEPAGPPAARAPGEAAGLGRQRDRARELPRGALGHGHRDAAPGDAAGAHRVAGHGPRADVVPAGQGLRATPSWAARTRWPARR